MSAVALFSIGLAVVCCGLCIFGITRAVRRSRERQEREAPLLTPR